jgi:hypothetical protein
MTEYEYDERIQKQTTQFDSNTAQVKSSKSNLPGLKPVDPRASEVSLKILSSTTETAENKIAEEHKVGLEKKSLNSDGAPIKRADSVRSNAIASSNGDNVEEHEHLNSDTTQQKEIQEQLPKTRSISGQAQPNNGALEPEKVEEEIPIESSAIIDQIQSMNEEDLKEALGKTEFEDYIDEIIARLEELDKKADKSIAEQSDVKEKELKTASQETSISKNLDVKAFNLDAKAFNLDAKAFNLDAKVLNLDVSSLNLGANVRKLDTLAANLERQMGFSLQKMTNAPPEGGNKQVTDPRELTPQNAMIFEKGVLMTSKENAKKYQIGQKLESPNEHGKMVAIREIKTFTKEQEDALNDFHEAAKRASPEELSFLMKKYFISLPPSPSVTDSKEDESLAVVSPQIKYLDSHSASKGQGANQVVNPEKSDRVTTSPDRPYQLASFLSNYKKRQERQRKIEDEKIKADVKRHDKNIEDINKYNLKVEMNKANVNKEDIKSENLSYDNDFKKTIDDYLKLVKHMEDPQPLREIFKGFALDFHRYDKVINKANEYPPEVVSEVLANKKMILATVKDMLRDTGGFSNVRTGQDGRSR